MSAGREALLAKARERIRTACQLAGRSESDITLVAVSKTKPYSEIAAYFALGQKDFGENYVQEAALKQAEAKAAGAEQIRWHFIGTLQSNKAKFVAGNFSLFHSLDSLSLAQKMDRLCHERKVIQDCLIEVNVDGETSKGGQTPEALPFFLSQLNSLQNLRIRGLMCIPEPIPGRDPRAPFAALRELKDQINRGAVYREKITELSMGMSADFEAAILEGATHVRIGTLLFGERDRK